MVSGGSETMLANFVCGWALLAVAAAAYRAAKAGAWQSATPRLAIFALAAGLGQWATAAALQFQLGDLGTLLRVLLDGVALVALIECIEAVAQCRPLGLSPRWFYLPAGAAAAVTLKQFGLGSMSTLETGLLTFGSLSLAGWLGWQTSSAALRPALAAATALLPAYFAAGYVASPVPRTLLALLGLGAWLNAIRQMMPATAPARSLARRLRAPACWLIFLCVGALATHESAIEPPKPLPQSATADEESTDRLVSRMQPGMRNWSAYGLAGGLIASFVAGLGVLSRVPAFR